MGSKAFISLLTRFADVRSGEERKTAFLFLYFFFITFPAYIIKPVRDSFLLNLKTGRFPLADLLTAGLIGFVVVLNASLLQRLPRRRYISGTIIFFIISLVIFWALFSLRWPVLSFVYWFWSDVFMATSITLFWIAVNDAYHPHQARRLVGLFVSGGLFGGIAGSLLSLTLVHAVGTRNLLLACPVLLLFTLASVRALYKEVEKDVEGKPDSTRPPRVGYLEGFRLLKAHRYLLLIAGVLACAMIAGRLIDYQFKDICKAAFPDQDLRTSFLGTFYLGLLAVSSVFHLTATNRVLKKSGIRFALLVAPVLLLFGSAAIFAIPAAFLIAWAVFARGADKSLDNTLSQSVRELLYIPVPSDVKYKAKMFIDMFVSKFATGLGALIFLAFYEFLHITIRQVSFLTIAVILAWILLIRLTSREYVAIVKKDLLRKWEEGEDVVARHLDLDTTRLVFDTLQSRDRSSTLYAMNLFDLLRQDRLTPEIKAFLTAKNDEVRARSMDALLDVGGETFFTGAEDILADADFETQVREIMSLDSYNQVMGGHIEKVLSDSREMEVARMEAAKLIGLMAPTSEAVKNLTRLLQDASPEVLHYALESAAQLKRKEFVPFLIKHLGNPSLSQVAAEALAAYGSRIMGTLRDVFRESSEDIRIREAIPSVVARIGTQKAADILLDELGRREGGMDTALIDAMYRLRSEHPELCFREDRVLAEVFRQIHKGYEIVLEALKEEGVAGSALSPLASSPAALTVKRIFDLLCLVNPCDDIVKAYQNLCQGTKVSIDYSLELLDNILPAAVKEALFPLIEDLPSEEKARRLRKLLRGGRAPASGAALKAGQGAHKMKDR